MKTIACLGTVVAAIACVTLTSASLAADHLIVVTGSGSAEMQPDRVTVEFMVINRGRTAAEASSVNAQRTRPILEGLRALGIPDTAVTSAGFAVQPSYDYKRGARRDESTATHRVRVKVAEIRSAGAIVETVLDKGADRIEFVSFSVSNPDSGREAAIRQAVEQARGDAEVMARAAGGTLGPLIEITTQGTAAPPRIYEASIRAGSVSASPLPSIAPGPIGVSVTVLGRWGFTERKAGPSKR
jgi:uncharacterized protein YggE